MKNTLIYFLVALSLKGFSQTLCSGLLLDSVNKQPIEFANIGIIGKGIGTVSDEKGAFSFQIPDSLKNETIKVSMIGYRSKQFSVASTTSGSKILLASEAVNLKEVVVIPRKNKIKVLGNETRTSNVSGGFKKNSLGAEIGVRLNIKHPNTQLRKFMLNINKNSLEQNPIFRLNVYSVSDKGMPKENILKQNIIIEPKEKLGFIEVDLTPYAIFADDDVFISIEWIKDLGDARGLYFSTKLVGAATYFRQASQDKWEKTSPIGIGIHVEVGY